MPVKLNTEFNYRYQIEGNTPWEKIKQLNGFLEGRKRAAVLERVGHIKYEAKKKELEHLKNSGAADHVIMNIEAELIEAESFKETEAEAFELNRQEIKIIEKVLAELHVIAETTRIPGYTDEEMFEANAANEFTAMIGREIYAEIMANGRASPAKLRNAMSNPHTMKALKDAGLLPEQMQYIEGGNDPLNIGLKCTVVESIGWNQEKPEALQTYQPMQTLANYSSAPKISNVIPLFPTPLHVSQFDGDMGEIVKFVLGLEYQNQNNERTTQSKDNFVLENAELQNIKKFFYEQIKDYCKNVLQTDSKLEITQSWINMAKEGQSHHYHTHPNSIVSGVFYINLDENNPPIMFYKNMPAVLQPQMNAVNEFNAGDYCPQASIGTLLLFPSHLPHSVSPNFGKNPRISLSFNTFAVDSLGAKEMLTYANLKNI